MTTQEQFSLNIEKKPSEVVIAGKVPAELTEKKKADTIATIKKNRSFDGYRDGTIPDDLLIQRVGELSVWVESASEVIRSHIAEIIAAAEVVPLGKPVLVVHETALGGVVGFNVTVDIYPEITLPDYRAIAKKAGPTQEIQITDEEVNVALSQLRADFFRSEHRDQPVPDSLPPLTDEQVRAINPQCQTVEQFVQFFRNAFKERKQFDARAKRRATIMKEIVDGMQVEISQRVLESEVEALVESVRNEVQQMGGSFESFLEEQKTNEQSLRSDFQKTARERICVQFALNEIAKKEDIQMDAEKAESEAKRIQARDASVSEHDARILARSIMTNEQVFVFLENTADLAITG